MPGILSFSFLSLRPHPAVPDFFNLDFHGTASRTTFWKNQLACIVTAAAMFLVGLAVLFVFAVPSGWAAALATALALLCLAGLGYCVLSTFAVGARRCRDSGHSAGLVLLNLHQGFCLGRVTRQLQRIFPS